MQAENKNSPLDTEIIAREAISMSFKPLPCETAVTGRITPEPSDFGRLLCKRGSRRAFSGKSIPYEKLERILVDCSGGVEIKTSSTSDGVSFDMLHRTIPQGGGVTAVGTCLILLRPSGDLQPGLYKFCAHSNSLHTLNKPIDGSTVARSMWWTDISKANSAAAILVITANFTPKEYKYGKLGYRLALIEVGCALQNASLSLCDQDLIGYAHAGIDGEIMAEMFDLSFPMEAPYVALIIGVPDLVKLP